MKRTIKQVRRCRDHLSQDADFTHEQAYYNAYTFPAQRMQKINLSTGRKQKILDLVKKKKG